MATKSGTISIDEFRKRIRETEVACYICGTRAFSLVRHLSDKHDLTPGQYRKLHSEAKFCSPIVSELLRRLDRKAQTTDDLASFTAAFEFGADLDATFAEARKKLSTSTGPDAKIPAKMPHFFFPKMETEAVLTGLILGKNVYIEGPTGCGKTGLVHQIHAKLERPIQRANMNGDVTAANFVGAMRANRKRGTYFHYGMLPEAMRGGYPLIIDEVDYTPPQIAAVLNPTLEDDQAIFLEETGETIRAEEGFIIIATGNTGGKGDLTGVYTGTEILNSAFLDRFPIKLRMDYLPQAREVEMLEGRFPDESREELELITKAAIEVRTAFKQGQLSVTLSTRKLVEYLELKRTLGEIQARNVTLLNWLDDDDRQLVVELLGRVGMTVD